MSSHRLLLIGCEILRKEIEWLIEEHHWPVDTLFLDSTLHCGLEQLAQALKSALAANEHRNVLVFYGCCHPRIDAILQEGRTFRTEGQNCIDMLLGHETFDTEVRNGAYFLFEDWGRRWDEVMTKAFGTSKSEIIREIFQGDRTYLLCLRTPCTTSFVPEAEHAGQSVGLPLQWRDVTLENLKSVLEAAIAKGLQVAV